MSSFCILSAYWHSCTQEESFSGPQECNACAGSSRSTCVSADCRLNPPGPFTRLHVSLWWILRRTLKVTLKVAAGERKTAVFFVSRRVSSERVSVNSAVTAYSPAWVSSPLGKPYTPSPGLLLPAYRLVELTYFPSLGCNYSIKSHVICKTLGTVM